MSQDPFNPYQPPEASQLEHALPVGHGDEALPPLPWEDKERFPGFWKRVGEMFSLVCSDPLGFFGRVPRGRGFTGPWQFQMLLLAPALMLFGGIFLLVGAAGMAASLGGGRGHGEPPLWIFGAVIPILLLLMPLAVFLGMVIGGAFKHFFLWIWGGLKQGEPMEQTIRAYGYANAFISLGGMIPYLGILVQLAGLVWMGMGLARLHRTDTWRGICAILTPIVLICCCVFAVLIPLLASGRFH
jgi:hypothetical protein